MITDQVAQVASPSTSIERPVLHKGQIENQDQIREGRLLVVHGPDDFEESVVVIRGPFSKGGCRCVTLFFRKRLSEQTVPLADLSVVRYRNGTWNIDNWLGNY
jgi:hypothetical protein